MISTLVSTLLNPAATAGAADKAAAHQQDEDKNRPIISTGMTARPAAARLDRVSVHQSGAGARIDYFHAAKKMLRDSLTDFAGGVRESFADIGLDDGMTEKFTKAMMRQTKNALLWGVGFSVKLMTATVSQASDADNDGTRPAFSIMARSIEITVNHSKGVMDVSTGSVSIETQFPGGPGTPQSHLLDISDSGGQSTGNLTSALQALQDPRSLFDEMDDEVTDDTIVRADTVVAPERVGDIEKNLPRIDTPRVLSRPNYNSRILLSEMDHFRNDRDELITYLRLDALIPLTNEPAATVVGTTASLPPPTRSAFV